VTGPPTPAEVRLLGLQQRARALSQQESEFRMPFGVVSLLVDVVEHLLLTERERLKGSG
jgi:hypothetical protein